MKKILLLTAALTTLGLGLAFAQAAGGPHLSGSVNKLFGTNQAFSAAMQFQVTQTDGNRITMPGKISFDGGQTRFEMNMSDVQGSQLTPEAAQQLKTMGMDTLVAISRPDLKLGYLIYPSLNSYAEVADHDAPSSVNLDDYKLETTELGKETVDGHDCVKSHAVVTDKNGGRQESTVWNASDLKNFPVKIITNEGSNSVTMLYQNVSFTKPDAAMFAAPAGYTKYDNMQTMMQTEIMKRMGGGMGGPPAQQ